MRLIELGNELKIETIHKPDKAGKVWIFTNPLKNTNTCISFWLTPEELGQSNINIGTKTELVLRVLDAS